MLRRAVAFFVLLAACREQKPAEAPPPAPLPTAPLIVGSSDAGAPAKIATADAGAPKPRIPASLVHLVEPDERLLLGPFAWPPKGTSIFVGQLSISFVWKTDVAEDHDAMPTDRTPTRALVKDVDGDGEPELVVFLAPLAQALAAYEDRATLWIFAVRPGDRRVARMRTLEYDVMGATDERTLDAELASINGLGPIAGVPIERIVTRLRLATADELRALVPATGLRVCHRQAMRRSCSQVSRGTIDAKTTKKLMEKPGAFAKYANDDLQGLQAPGCEEKPAKNGTTITCSASVGGPEGGQWVFERKSTGLELVEIGSWAEDS